MFKHLKAIATMGAMTAALMTSAPAFSQSSPFPKSQSATEEVSVADVFWTPGMMVKMDRNKDGMVSRVEFVDYMGKQFDIMDTDKKSMLTKSRFTDKIRMSGTFPKSGFTSGIE